MSGSFLSRRSLLIWSQFCPRRVGVTNELYVKVIPLERVLPIKHAGVEGLAKDENVDIEWDIKFS